MDGTTFNFEIVSMKVKSPDGALFELKSNPTGNLDLAVNVENYQMLLEAISIMDDIYRNSTDQKSRMFAWEFMSKAVCLCSRTKNKT